MTGDKALELFGAADQLPGGVVCWRLDGPPRRGATARALGFTKTRTGSSYVRVPVSRATNRAQAPLTRVLRLNWDGASFAAHSHSDLRAVADRLRKIAAAIDDVGALYPQAT